MVKEVEIKKLNGETQYVDWETGEELFKISDCIPISYLENKKKELNKLAEKEDMWSGVFVNIINEIDMYDKIIKEYKNGR